MATLTLKILDETSRSTVSELLYRGSRLCYVIEDAGQDGDKVPGETRIPAGDYPVEPRQAGRFYERYSRRWGHSFVPWLRNVIGFTWILIHLGNSHKDTRGCLLPATSYYRADDGHYYGRDSTRAYLNLYKVLEASYGRGEEVELKVVRSYPPPLDEPPAEDDDEEPPADEEPKEPISKPSSGCLSFLLALLGLNYQQ